MGDLGAGIPIMELADLEEEERVDVKDVTGQEAVGDTLEEHRGTTIGIPVAVVVVRTTLGKNRLILQDIRQMDMALFILSV